MCVYIVQQKSYLLKIACTNEVMVNHYIAYSLDVYNYETEVTHFDLAVFLWANRLDLLFDIIGNMLSNLSHL